MTEKHPRQEQRLSNFTALGRKAFPLGAPAARTPLFQGPYWVWRGVEMDAAKKAQAWLHEEGPSLLQGYPAASLGKKKTRYRPPHFFDGGCTSVL